mgnify:CR=1 FL=1
MRQKQTKPCPTCRGSGEIDIHIGDRIKAFREAKGLTQAQLAEKLPITRPQVANIELGRGEPSMGAVRALCDALDVTADELLFGEMP